MPKKKIKIRDLTKEQYHKYLDDNCPNIRCSSCPFGNVECIGADTCWFNHKDLYSDKFLNQEVEIEVPELLDKVEKEYLENFFRPYKKRLSYIRLKQTAFSKNFYFMEYILNGVYYQKEERHDLPVFKKGTMYKNLEVNRGYTLEELGLFQDEKKYKIKFSEFWKSKDKLAIHCKTEEEANIFCEKADKLGKTWHSYTFNSWNVYEQATCYNNSGEYCDYGFYKKKYFKIYEFEEVDFNN